jgi:hypothetical protein
VVTHHANAPLEGSLSLSQTVVFLNEATTVTATVRVGGPVPPDGIAIGPSVDGNGLTEVWAELFPTSDARFWSGTFERTEGSAAVHELRARAQFGAAAAVTPAVKLHAVTMPTTEQLEQDDALAEEIEGIWQAARLAGQDPYAAATARLAQDAAVHSFSPIDQGGVWWVSSIGLGFAHLELQDGIRGSAGASSPLWNRGSSPMRGSTLSRGRSAGPMDGAGTQVRVGPKSALALGPFADEFGLSDETTTLKVLFDNHTCPDLVPTFAALNDQADLAAFAGQFASGLTSISSHGFTVLHVGTQSDGYPTWVGSKDPGAQVAIQTRVARFGRAAEPPEKVVADGEHHAHRFGGVIGRGAQRHEKPLPGVVVVDHGEQLVELVDEQQHRLAVLRERPKLTAEQPRFGVQARRERRGGRRLVGRGHLAWLEQAHGAGRGVGPLERQRERAKRARPRSQLHHAPRLLLAQARYDAGAYQ